VPQWNAVETRSIDYVPLAERHGKVRDLWPIWFTGDAHLATLATGALAIPLGLSLGWAMLAIIGGSAMGTFFMAFHSTQGPQLGLPQMIQSRPQFGYRGAFLVWFVALATYIGFNAFNQVLVGETMRQLAGVDPVVSFVVFTVAALSLAVIGYDLIHAAQRWLAYALILTLGLFSVGICFVATPDIGLNAAGFRTTPFLIQFFAAAAYQLSWSIYVSDYSRYLPRSIGVRAAFWWTFLGAFFGCIWVMLVGALASAMFPLSDVIAATRMAGDMLTPGFGTILLLVSMTGLLTITSLNFYGASLTLLSIADSFATVRRSVRNRVISLLIVATASTVLATLSSANIREKYHNLLSILLYLFTPWTAINLVDFFFVRKGHYSVREIFNPNGIYGRWSWRGLSAYAVGFAAMIPFFSTGFYTGPAAKALGGADVSMLIGLPVAALVYLAACRSLDMKQELVLVRLADAGLEP